MANHQTRVYDSILGLVPSEANPTPLVRLNKVTGFKHAVVYGKLEWYNPFGAVKDRVAMNLINDAEEKGLLGKGQKLVEPTSGNTGMGLAMVANAKGYHLTTPLSTAIPPEKRTMLRMFGAEVIELEDTLCPAPGAPEGAIAKAEELGSRPDYHMFNQYANMANPEAHMKTTGPEIWRQTGGKITHFAAGLGTCGTITGNCRYLKGQNEDIKVIAVHPEEGHDIPGVRSLKQLRMTKLFFPDEYDHIEEVSNEDAYNMCRRVNLEESIFAGPSAAMALTGALRHIPDEPGVVAVVMFADNTFRYATSFAKHLPGVGAAPRKSRNETLMAEMIENARANPELTIEIAAAREMIQSKSPKIVDVREFNSYEQGHLEGAENMPLADISEYTDSLPENKNDPILVVCQRGNMSLSGALYLQSLGYKNVRSINGGTSGWTEAGLPVSKN